MSKKKTFKFAGVLIILVGIFIVGFEIEQNLDAAENDYGMMSAGLINILGGIMILGSVKRQSKE